MKSNEEKIKTAWPGWEVTRTIGQGSFGSVYEIQRIQFEKTEKAAVKVLTIPCDRSIIDELYSEGYDDASISKRLNGELQDIVKEYYLMTELKGHTNVVNCDDMQYTEHEEGVGWDVFIKLELLTPLFKVFGKGESVSDEAVIKLGKDICRALTLCEKKNIVHRDIKPQNIFRSEFGEYKLGDFGIAKTMEHTTIGTKTGTYKYMAPEVYSNRPYGHSADIYSLGLILYWLLNEKRMPFLPLPPEVPTSSMEDAARTKRFGGVKILEPKNGSPALKEIILKACEFEPKDRFASAQEMLNALKGLSGTKENYYEDAHERTIGRESAGDEENNFSGTEMNLQQIVFSDANEDTMGNSWDDRSATMGATSGAQRQAGRKEEGTVGADRSVLKKEASARTSVGLKKFPSGMLDHAMDWKDAVLEAKMRTITGIHNRAIMLSDVYHLTSLDLLEEDILDKKGKARRISNYEALLELTQIQKLIFDKKGLFASVSAERLVKELPNLKQVAVGDTLLNLDKVNFPISCGLREVVYESTSTRLKFLKHMPNLEVLKLYGITNLEYWFGSEKVREMILGLPKLKKLWLKRANIYDGFFLGSMTGLEELKLFSNKIKDITPLKSLTKLKDLELAEEHIEDIIPLQNLTKLERLWLIGKNIRDLSSLISLSNLQFLYIDTPKVQDISILSKLPNLKYILVTNNCSEVIWQQCREMQQKNCDERFEVWISKDTARKGTERTVVREGKQYVVKIPAGIKNGQAVRMKGKSRYIGNNGERGDLLIGIRVTGFYDFGRHSDCQCFFVGSEGWQNDSYSRVWEDTLLQQQENLYLDQWIMKRIAVEGGIIKVSIGDKYYEVKVPAGTSDGSTLRLRGCGKPGKNGERPGDLLISIHIIPDDGL